MWWIFDRLDQEREADEMRKAMNRAMIDMVDIVFMPRATSEEKSMALATLEEWVHREKAKQESKEK